MHMNFLTKNPNLRTQWQTATALLLLPIVMLLGCGATQPAGQQAQSTPRVQDQAKERAMDSQQPSPANSNPAAGLDALLKKGMAYGDFRKLILTKSWEPVVNPECKANLVGDGADDLCAKNPQLTSCKICDELPELDSCSSDAHCLMRFHHPDAAGTLEVTGYGEVEYWNETGEDAGLQVTGWEIAASKEK
jgi:hypothetical protein